ncbi:hypothetical protein HGRIS_013261 [Hohenbuehelia grisea]|uniref:F-box domain-containing protein n=1 Tax=Hohenbuehelia grisea TaxID=104357 RepID=A0ABR3IV45_9AGAR
MKSVPDTRVLMLRKSVAGIDDLPTEMLMRIFDCYHPLKEFDLLDLDCPLYRETFPDFSPVGPVTLSHVCRTWRNIVSSAMPHLWSLISFIHEPITPQLLSYAAHFLEHSRSANLYIGISCEFTPFSQANAGDIDSLINLLIPQQSRWRAFHMLWAGPPPSSLLTASFENLETVNIRGQRDELLRAVCRAPRLRSLRCQPRDIPRLNEAFSFPPVSITELSIAFQPITLDDMRLVLRNCQHLISLDCTVYGESQTTEEATLRKLRHLHVAFLDDSSTFFDMLNLPNLKYLELDFFRDSRLSSGDALGRLLDRSQCKLRILHLASQQSQLNDALPSIFRLRGLQNLKEIQISTGDLSTHLIPSLAVCLPRIRDIMLHFEPSPSKSFLARQFARMVLSRVQRVVKDEVGELSPDADLESSDDEYFDKMEVFLHSSSFVIGIKRSTLDGVGSASRVDYLACTNLPVQPGGLFELVEKSDDWHARVQAALPLEISDPLLAEPFMT